MTKSSAVDSKVAQSVQDAAVHDGTGLLIWTVYERPADYPDRYIARAHMTLPGQTQPLPFHLEAATLEGVRAKLPAGLTCLPRAEGDEPQILESWL